MSLSNKVEEVNKTLDSFGAKAIQVDNTRSYKAIGYRPQFVIDAMNKAFGVGGWSHNVEKIEQNDVILAKSGKTRTAVHVLMTVTLKDGETTFTTGQQAGESFIVQGSVGNAIKSAITDGLGKCLALLSVGNKAYRGELEQGSESIVVVETNDVESDIATTVTTKPSNGNGSGRFKIKPEVGETNTTVQVDTGTTEAPQARFRSSGLTTPFQQKS